MKYAMQSGVPDRAQRKVFTSGVLRPTSLDYVTLSQKMLSAAAARFVLFWLANLLGSLLRAEPGNMFLQSLGSCYSIFCVLGPCNHEQVYKQTSLDPACVLEVRAVETRLRAGVVMALARMEELMCMSGRFMARNVCEEFRDHYHIYRAGWNRLCDEALAAGVCRWPLKPKHHYTEHMALDTVPLNPRYLHNFVCEDMVRRIKALAIKSHPAYLAKHVVLKYCLQCCLRWRKMKPCDPKVSDFFRLLGVIVCCLTPGKIVCLWDRAWEAT